MTAPLPRPPLRLEISAGLQGAALLGRAQPQGLLLMAGTPAGAWRSCWAALVCLPAFLALRADDPPLRGVLGALLQDIVLFTLGWFGFLVMSERLVAMMGRAALWPRFVAAWNWSNVVQYGAMLVTLLLPAHLGAPPLVTQTLALVGLGYAIWLEWFVTRWALQATRLQATALVGADLALGMLVQSLMR
jgi:hypothetical protein